MRIKAISLWQPWATFMAYNIKTIETRSWGTLHRGPLAIHATVTIPREARMFMKRADINGLVLSLGFTPESLPMGAVLAVVDLQHTRRTKVYRPPTSLEQLLGDYKEGRYAWITKFMFRFREPIRATGGQRLWDWELPAEYEQLIPMLEER